MRRRACIVRASALSRPTRRAEYWTWDKHLGGGGYGDVWLQRCVKGKRRYESRAVKVIVLDGGGVGRGGKGQINYIRELETIAKFSQKRVGFYSLQVSTNSELKINNLTNGLDMPLVLEMVC